MNSEELVPSAIYHGPNRIPYRDLQWPMQLVDQSQSTIHDIF